VLVILGLYLELITHKVEKALMDKVQDRCESMIKILGWNAQNF